MKQKFFIFPVLVLLILLSCSKDKNDDDDKKNEYEAGFNETCNPVTYPGLEISIDGDVSSELDPESSAFDDYIACLQDCSETNPDDPQCMMNCLNLLGAIPAGGAFSLTLYITNTTGSEITYIVEPGDWFEPGSGDYQPMISPIRITEVISPGESKTLVIPVYCLASEKSAPDAESAYSMCDMISSSGCLQQIIDILETKDMSSLDFSQSFDVQLNIWNCIEGNEVDWDYLNGLPAK